MPGSRAGLAALGLLLWAAAQASSANAPESRGESVVVRSPDGRIAIELLTREVAGAPGQVQYRVSLSDRTVVDASSLGLRLKGGRELGRNSAIVASQSIAIDTSFEQFPGKRRRVIDRANEATVTLRERGAKPLEWKLVVRAYDDGIALRYRFPSQPGWNDLEVAGELTEFNFPADAAATALPLASFATSHEARYERRRIGEIPGDWLLGLPLLVELPDAGWAAVLEANLTDYAGLYLARSKATDGTLVSRLSPLPGEPGVAVRASLPHESPWRLILVSDDLRQLLDSDTVLKLNAPSAIADTSWIRPGLTTFPWWNDFFETAASFKMGLNTETAKYYIDFCAEYGIPYHTLDGFNGQAWYGGNIVPYEGADITRGIDGLDLPEVIAYARQKGVRLRLWMHWQAARQHMARAFPLYRSWGIEGVMIDFMDRDDQEMVQFQRKLLELAAENRLTVTFHGVAAPTGLERTFPNLLTSEAVLNYEHNKWDKAGVTPDHDVTVTLTRMLAGPLDYHQGSFRGVAAGEFEARAAAPLVVGTPVRMLASYVVFQNHLPMMADYPSAYRRHPLTKVMAAVPATWDDTKAICARQDEEIVIARRSGNDWWIGAMAGSNPRDVKVPLSFLPAGTFRAIIYRDDPATEHGFAQTQREVSAADELDLALAAAGGAVVRLILQVDGVRAYDLVDGPGQRAFQNGGFEEKSGSAADRQLSGNPVDGNPNVRVQGTTGREGGQALRISGQRTVTDDSGASQGISVAAGQRVRARLPASVRADQRLTNPGDRAFMKFGFYNHRGECFGGPAMESVTERAIADSKTVPDAWQDYQLEAVAPAGSVEARLTLVFGQAADAPGAVCIDAVEFSRTP